MGFSVCLVLVNFFFFACLFVFLRKWNYYLFVRQFALHVGSSEASLSDFAGSNY